MKKLFQALLWDFLMEWRYGIIPVALFMTGAYSLSIYCLKSYLPPEIISLLLFSDPMVFGFIFAGAMILFEKDCNTLAALAVNPIGWWRYMAAKALTLTAIIVPIVFGIIWFTVPHTFSALFPLLYGMIGTSFLFILLGIIGTGMVETFNQYMIIVPLFLIPLCIPLVGLWANIHPFLLWLIPTQATLHLLQSYYKETALSVFVYSYLYLTFSVGVTFIGAVYSFGKIGAKE
jgi:fluoroquinolone transport system permease protein